MFRLRSRLAALIATACGLVAAGSALPAHAAGQAGWRVSASIAGRSEGTYMTTLAVVSARDAWALGFTDTPTREFAIIRRWNGRTWASVQPPAKIAAAWDRQFPDFVTAAASRTSLLMFSTASNGYYLLHTGKHWRLGKLPGISESVSYDITGAAVFGPGNAWALGVRTAPASDGFYRYSTYAAHFNGSRWTAVPVPLKSAATSPSLDFPALSAISPRNIWAISGSTVLRWTGDTAGFTRAAVQPPLARGAVLTSIATAPGGTVWVAGIHGKTPFTARWNGSAWALRSLPASARNFTIISLAAHGQGGLWAIGATHPNGKPPATRLWRYSGRAWTGPVALHLGAGQQLFEVAPVPRTDTTWAVGTARAGAAVRGIIAVDGPTPR
jgi:hypothetical protein